MKISILMEALTGSFETDMKRASRETEKAAKKMQKDLEESGKAIGQAFAIAATAVAVLVKNSLDNADQLSKLSQKVGVSVESLSALKHQAGLSGVEMAALETGLKKFNKTIAEAAGGSKLQADTFKAMGVSLKDSNGNLKSTEELLGDVADRFAEYEDGAAKTALAMNLFGRAGADMIVQLNGGRKAMAEAAQEASDLGQIIGTETAKQAEQFNDNMSRAGMLATGFGNILSAKLLPSLVGVSDEFIRGQKESKDFESAAEGLADVLKTLARAAILVKGAIEVVATFIAAFYDVLVKLGGAVKSIVEGMGQASAGAILKLKGDFAGADKAFAEAKESFSKGWEGGATSIKSAFAAAGDSVKSIIDRNGKLIDALDASMAKPAETARKITNGLKDAPIVNMGSAAKKAAVDFDKLQESIASGQQSLDDLARSTVEHLDPMNEAFAQFETQIISIGRAAEDQQAKIESFLAGGGDPGAAAEAQAAAQAAIATAMENVIATRDRNISSIEAERNVTDAYLSDMQKEAKLIGLSYTQQRIETTVLRALADAKRLNAAAGKEVAKVDEARIRQQAKLNEALNIAASVNQKSPFEAMIEEAQTLGESIAYAIKEGFDPELIKPMQDALGKLNSQIAIDTIGSYKALLGAVQTFTKEGSTGFKNIEKGMAALSIIQDIIAIKAAVSAVLTQGQGEPYSAWARMAAMAAAVAPLLASIGASIGAFSGGGGGPSSQSAEVRQAKQGTGSILGDANAKSESIANSSEIIADATSKLVGINRGMATSLKELQSALGAAGGMLARGAGNVDFGEVGGSGLFLGLFGDSRKIIDQGIVIAGGALNAMLDNIVVGAYQTIHQNGGLFGSSRDYDRSSDITDAFGRQFELIMGSIADTVREGATALGILPAEIEAAMAAYQVAEIRISLKDLSAEEQQAELSAVFSSIFDGLAGAVVPFIEQFQKVGEGLGETLIRVATGVQVTQEAIKQLGLVINETDPERFAQISEGLIDAVGGLDEFIAGMQNFVAAFADDQHKLQVATEALNSAFEQAGLSVPATAEGMFALMQTLDATTEAGQEQIATLLRLSSTASQYYDLLEKAEKARRDYAERALALQDELNPNGGFIAGRNEIDQWLADTTQSLNDLARAAGRAGASERDLVNAHSVAAQRIAQLIKKLKDAATDLAVQLGYTNAADTIDSLNARIDSLSSASADAGDAIGSAVDSMREKMNLLLGDLSPFNDQKKLELALQGLREGTVDPQQVLEIGRRLYASTSNYTDLFNQVMGMATFGGSGDSGSNSASSEQTRTLSELIAARDALIEAQRPELADELARRIAELAYATGDDFGTLAESMGFGLDQLAEDLGLNSEQLNAYLQQLEDQFNEQDFADVGAMIQDAINNSADRIVEAITGEPIETASQASDERMAQIATDQDARREASDQATIAAINGLTSAVIASGAVNADRVVEVLDLTRRDLREERNRTTAGATRGRAFQELTP